MLSKLLTIIKSAILGDLHVRVLKKMDPQALKFTMTVFKFLENWRSSRSIKASPVLPLSRKIKCD